MEGVDAELITQHGLSDNCILEYFGTLYEVISHFRCTGEEILRRNGFRSRSWVESLFAMAAKHHCFANEKCPEGLPFEVVQPLITQELIAMFCLGSDILETAFYERLLLQQQRALSTLPSSRTANHVIRDLRIARRKICKRKQEYLDLAYGSRLAKNLVEAFDVCSVYNHNKLQRDVMLSLDILPIVFQLYPRDENTPDMAPVRKLCRKSVRLFSISAEFEEPYAG